MRSLWFARIVLLAASALLIRLGLDYAIDPRGAAERSHTLLQSAGAITATRVIGTLFIAIAALLLGSLPARRVLGGLTILAMIAIALFAMRAIGYFVDGSDPFTVRVLKPELALAVISSVALAVERRRRARGVA